MSNPCDRTISHQHADRSWTYIVPRPLNGGTIIGATREENDWNPHVDILTRNKLLLRAAKIHPAIIANGLPPNGGGFTVVSDIVGRRSARHGGPRIEREALCNKTVIHAYGVGYVGYKVSWGAAENVLKLLKNVGKF